jgi:hypothetical protein
MPGSPLGRGGDTSRDRRKQGRAAANAVDADSAVN